MTSAPGNEKQPAIVYSERNLPITFKALQTKMTIDEMPITRSDSSSNWYIKRV